MISVLSLYAPCGGGGVMQVCRNLRSTVGEFGVDFRWIGCGKEALRTARQYALPEDWEYGEIIGQTLDDDKERAEEYLRHILSTRPTIVLHHVMCGQVESNLAAYLPGEIPRIGLVHTISPSTYRGARAIRDYLNATIGVSPRIRENLVKRYGFSTDTTFMISNGIQCKAFVECPREDASGGPLRILSCGRIEDISKGVFWLPEILKKVRSRGLNVRMTIAGDGPDKSELERRINSAGMSGIAEFPGWVQREDLPRLYADHDVFLFPSRFEGLGLTVIEAMAAGCVPVATRIRGVTDFIIENGKTGLLFPSGDTEAAARMLVDLAANQTLQRTMREACRSNASGRFQIRDQAKAFVAVVEKVMQGSKTINAALQMNKWEILPGLRPAWWTSLPEPLKNSLRVLRERLPN